MNLFSLKTIQFVLIFWVLSRYLVKPNWRHGLMTAGAVLFIFMQDTYFYWLTFSFIALTFGVLGAGWAFGRKIERESDDARKRKTLIGGAIVVFSPLVLIKVVQIVLPPQLIEAILAIKGEVDLGALAPLGISYFSFRAVAYLIEIRRGNIQPVGWWPYLNYVAFWPTMMAGPIERPRPFFDQTAKPPDAAAEDLRIGFTRILTGVFKKMVLGEFFYRIANPYILLSGASTKLNLGQWPVWHLWLCVHAYYFYLYCDFSGYSDVAIGVSRLFGYRIMENFRWPILATNVSDFWRRWHISLTGWITDYVYFGLGGNRRGPSRAAWNTAAAMLFVGLWHGLSPHFAVWGLYHAFFLNAYRNIRARNRNRPVVKTWWRTALAGFATFQIVNLGWVLFVFGLSEALKIYARLLGL